MVVNSVKNSPVYSLDVKRPKGANLLYVVTGQSKGQVCLYEVRGLPRHGTMGAVSYKHIKTISDVHDTPVV